MINFFHMLHKFCVHVDQDQLGYKQLDESRSIDVACCKMEQSTVSYCNGHSSLPDEDCNGHVTTDLSLGTIILICT